MMNGDVTGRIGLAAAALAALLGAWSSAQATFGVVAYSGRATAVSATATALTSTHRVVISDTGEINPSGDARSETVASSSNPPPVALQSDALNAHAAGMNDTSAASSSIEKLSMSVAGVTITADVIEAHSSATCDKNSHTVSTTGDATVVNLRINGQPVQYKPAPNTKVAVIPGVVVVYFNEQSSPNVNTKHVTAVHIVIKNVTGQLAGDVKLAHVESGIVACYWSP